MSKIQYADKQGEQTGLPTKFDAQDVNEIKNSVNALYDQNLIGLTFAGEFNLSTGGEASYKRYTFNNALTPTIQNTPLVENSVCRVLLDAGAAASLVATNLSPDGNPRAYSDMFTPGKQNELFVFCLPDGDNGALVKSYCIKVLN